MGDIAHVNRRPPHLLYRQIVECGDGLRRVVEPDDVLERADLGETARIDLVLGGDRVGHRLRRQTLCLQGGRVQIHLNLPHLAARGIGHGQAGDIRQGRAHLVLRQIEHLLFGKPIAREGQLQHRHGRGAVIHDQRRRGARRIVAQRRLRNSGHLRRGEADVCARLEEDLHHPDALQRLALDMLDIVDGGEQRPLIRGDNARRHIRRRQAAILPDHSDNRDADIGENVDRGRDRRYDAQQQDQNCHHDERQWTLQRDSNNGNHRTSIWRSNDRAARSVPVN